MPDKTCISKTRGVCLYVCLKLAVYIHQWLKGKSTPYPPASTLLVFGCHVSHMMQTCSLNSYPNHGKENKHGENRAAGEEVPLPRQILYFNHKLSTTIRIEAVVSYADLVDIFVPGSHFGCCVSKRVLSVRTPNMESTYTSCIK